MAKSIILCEGETDQALLGCYLEKNAGWKFCKNIKNNPFPNELIWWYLDKNDNAKGIWQIGGNDFSAAVQSLFNREKLEHTIDSLVIVTDHDDQDAEITRLKETEESIKGILGEETENVQLLANEWQTVIFHDAFSKKEIRILYLLVPKEEFGALETFMMNALSEQSPEKEHVIKESRKFVMEFKSNVYLKKRREKIKAELGVSLSVFSPDRIFTTMKELIDSVEWEKFSETHKQFDLLNEFF